MLKFLQSLTAKSVCGDSLEFVISGHRQTESSRATIELIDDEGHRSLSMRALTRASAMKLGALQCHFQTWDALLFVLVSYIESEMVSVFESGVGELEQADVRDMVEFILNEHVVIGDGVFSDRLWAQLWAVEQVEPLVSNFLEEVCAKFLEHLETKLVLRGVPQPRAEALTLLSLIEGESLIMGSGRRWQKHRPAIRRNILQMVDERSAAKQTGHLHCHAVRTSTAR